MTKFDDQPEFLQTMFKQSAENVAVIVNDSRHTHFSEQDILDKFDDQPGKDILDFASELRETKEKKESEASAVQNGAIASLMFAAIGAASGVGLLTTPGLVILAYTAFGSYKAFQSNKKLNRMLDEVQNMQPKKLDNFKKLPGYE